MALRFSRIDRKSIRRLAIGEQITERGIRAERLKDGDIRYSVNIMVDGQRIHRVIGRESEGTTRTLAERFIEQKRSEAREGRLSLPQGRKTALTFNKAADDFVKRLEDVGGKDLENKRRHLKKYLKPFFASQRIDRITKFTVDRYKKKRQGKDASNGTINRELATLSYLFTKAVEWKWIKARPCMIEKYPEAEGRIIALTDEQCDALMTAAVADQDPDCWLFVAFGLNTAMRHSEILRARFEDIDFGQKRLVVREAKAGPRIQPITDELRDILRKELDMRDDKKGWIFPSPRPKSSRQGHRDRMDEPFRRAVKEAGMDPVQVTPHVMRHTAITTLVKAGVDLPTIQKISGHKTIDMVLRYTHVHGPHIDNAIKAIGRTIPEPKPNTSADTPTPKLHTFSRKR